MANRTDKAYLERWQEYRDNNRNATPIDRSENTIQKAKRIAHLESKPEEWFKYYFPNYYSSEPAPFHKRSTKRILKNAEWFEVRPWARELSKSGRTMMETLYLSLTGKKKTWILTSATSDKAEMLLLPFKSILETNKRIINDYGIQESYGKKWTASKFITKKGVSFRALGAGQNPRGEKNDEARPDGLIIDDIDTDEEVRNSDRIKEKVKWVMEALIPTRSISNPLLIIVCGNIIGKYTTVTELIKKADISEIVNIRDKKGKSTWPQKNTEAAIDRVLKTISHNSAQKEYFNNPIAEGDVFKKITYGKCPPLRTCEQVLAYSDPATSNKDKGNASTKGVGVIGYKNGTYYLYKIWLGTMGQSRFVNHLYDAQDYIFKNKVDVARSWIENNSLQNPFYQQVIKPLILSIGKDRKRRLSMSLDDRSKGDKYNRIEGTLEPIHRNGDLIFNVDEKENQSMQIMEDQMLAVSEKSKFMDGPDLLEGGVWIIKHRNQKSEGTYKVGFRSNRKY